MKGEELRGILGPLGVALGVVSLALPFVAFFSFEEPLGVPFDDPARVAYYRYTVFAFILGAVLGLVALLSGRMSPVRPLKLTGIGLGVVGMVISLLLFLTLVGLCGSTVLRGICNP